MKSLLKKIFAGLKRPLVKEETILDVLAEGVIAVDRDMKVRYVNSAASRLFGIPKRTLLGKSFPESQKKNALLLEKTKTLADTCQKKEMVLTSSISLEEGRKLYLDLIAYPGIKGKGATVIFQDKSNHHKVLEMGKDFVANASHELRTPITIIKGFAETLQDIPEISKEMLADILEKIVRNCQRMDNLVKNLLTLADIENLPESRFQECDLLTIIDNCRHLLLSLYPEATITIEKNQDKIGLCADSDLIELAIMNLFENAVKYSQGPARISASIQQQDEEVRIKVSDQGIGIPSQELEHVFERFYTVNKAHSRRLGGAGLGLSIVKTIVEKHEGAISADSTFGQGSTFTITLPYKPYSHRTGSI